MTSRDFDLLIGLIQSVGSIGGREHRLPVSWQEWRQGMRAAAERAGVPIRLANYEGYVQAYTPPSPRR